MGPCFFSILVVISLPLVRKKFNDKDAFILPFGNVIAIIFVIINSWMIFHLVSNDYNMLKFVLLTLILGVIFYLLTNYFSKPK